ncbi:MAG TPA: hypothetical protein VIV55_09965 [Flavobacterium sp.]
MKSSVSDGNNGCFSFKNNGFGFNVIASDMGEWEHVSVNCLVGKKSKTPTWEQMSLIKDMFWGEEDCVVQYHPPKSEYVNLHEHILHLWRPKNDELINPHKQ